jgi:hypothetical protein
MNTALKFVVAIGVVSAIGVVYGLTGSSFQKGYEQGYEDAEKALGTTSEQCYRWWFGENKKQFEHEMKQFCKRSGT